MHLFIRARGLVQMGLWFCVVLLVACGPVAATPPSATATLFAVIVTTPTASATEPATDTGVPPTPLPPTATGPATEPPSATVAPPTDTSVPPTPARLPTPDALAAGRRVRLPILMYHYVEPWPGVTDVLRQGLTVRPEDFQAQMDYLHEHGYVTVSLYDLIDALALGKPLPERAVVLTFDDGYRTLLDFAVPIMEPYGYTGTVFVITQLMDEGFAQYLTWPQAEALYAQGWKIEPHTKTHADLKGRGRDFQLYQMLGSLQTVEAHLGVTPRFLAYPSGHYDDLTLELAAEMNLWGAVTVEAGRVHTYADRFTLARVRVSGTGGLQDFINGVEGGN